MNRPSRIGLLLFGLALLLGLAWDAQAIPPQKRVLLAGGALGVTSVSPNSGPLAGGTSVTITGHAFTGATSVLFGATSATFVLVSSTTITATSPAHAGGTVDVTVTTPKGTSPIVASDQFTYANSNCTGAADLSTGCAQLLAIGVLF